MSSSPGHRSSAGIVFHADGHDTAKARGPIVEVLHRGTTRSPDELERRSCCLCNELCKLVDHHEIELAFNFSEHLPIAVIFETNIDTIINRNIAGIMVTGEILETFSGCLHALLYPH